MMRKLPVALVLLLGLARAAEEAPPAAPAPSARGEAHAKEGERGATPPPAGAKKKADAPRARRAEPERPAPKPPEEAPCEPVKPCPIDG